MAKGGESYDKYHVMQVYARKRGMHAVTVYEEDSRHKLLRDGDGNLKSHREKQHWPWEPWTGPWRYNLTADPRVCCVALVRHMMHFFADLVYARLEFGIFHMQVGDRRLAGIVHTSGHGAGLLLPPDGTDANRSSDN